MKRHFVLLTLAAGFLSSGLALASWDGDGHETCTGLQECPTAQKVNGLLTQWKAAQEEIAKVAPEVRQAQAEKMAKLAAQCPVGSRVNDTLVAVRDVLGFAVESCSQNAEHCPLKNAPQTEATKAGMQMAALRTEALGQLHELAGYAACATSCPKSGTECSKEATALVSTSAGEETCQLGAKSGCCPIQIAVRLGEMKASLVQARREAAAMSPAARGELLASFASMSEHCPCAKLVPESVMALAEGLEKLEMIDGKMAEWAKSNPDLMASVPASAHQTYMMQQALLSATRAMLGEMTGAMQALHPEDVTVGQVR